MKSYRNEILIGLVSGFFNGLFGAGGGSIAVPAMEKYLNMDEKRSHATAIAIILFLSPISMLFYLKKDCFSWQIFLWVGLGGILGGPVGARLLSKLPKHWIKIIFGTVLLSCAFKMIR